MKAGGDKSIINNYPLWCHKHYLNPQWTLHNLHYITRNARHNRDTEGTAVFKSSPAGGQHATICVNHLHARSCLRWFHKLQWWTAQWMPSKADLNRLHDLSWTLQYSQHWTTDMLNKGDIRRNSWTRQRSQCQHTQSPHSRHSTHSLARADHTDSSLLPLVRQTSRAMLLRVLNDCCALSQIILVSDMNFAWLIVSQRYDSRRGAIGSFCASTRILFRNPTLMAYNLRNSNYIQFLCQYLSTIWFIVTLLVIGYKMTMSYGVLCWTLRPCLWKQIVLRE